MPRSKRLNEVQAKLTILEIIEMGVRLKTIEPSLRGRSFEPGLGYPASSLGGGSGSGTGDPVGELVARGGITDPVAVALDAVHAAIAEAHRQLTHAINAHARTIAREPVKITEDDDGVWCSSCARAQVMSPRGDVKEVGRDSTLCGWCHAWKRTHGALPPVELVQRRATGERITNRVIDETMRSAS